MKKGLKYVAVLEGSKGLIALIVGFEIHRLASDNIQALIENLARHLHFNPASHFVGIINSELSKLTYSNLSLIAIGSLVYSVVRFIEAFGLWKEYKWIEWFALINGAIYIPFELYELVHGFNVLSIIVLTANVIIVGYLYLVLNSKNNRRAER